VIGNTVLLFVVYRLTAFWWSDGSNTLLYGGLLRLIWHPRITAFFRASSRHRSTCCRLS